MASSSCVRLHHLPSTFRRSSAPGAPTNLQFRAASCRWRRRVLVPGAASPPLRLCATGSPQPPLGSDSNAPLSRGTREEGEEVEEQRQPPPPPRLKIAVVGFGNFGQFLARTLVAQGHTVLAHSRSDHSAAAAAMGARFFPDAHDLCECHPDVVVLATSILSAESVVRSLPLHRLRRDTLFVDVLSVKEFPKRLLLGALPEEMDIICTHPMFGPESAPSGWTGLPFVFDRVRVGDSCPARRARAEAFLGVFAREGCRMVEMSCAEHDAHAAETQFLTHTVGRMLAALELRATPVDTRGYETLLRLVDNTCRDSFDLYNALFMYNDNSTELLHRLDWALGAVKRRLFDGLHGVLRRQLFGVEDGEGPAERTELLAVVPGGGPPDTDDQGGDGRDGDGDGDESGEQKND
uniref:Arogenate dehydrogenase isoform 2 n=1 Tax=Zea mays TaxID=4577 RepID=B6TPZ9_MAIZE|nr:arogenate dehydrogenase isoform 2 [Zea mays]|eukprot:NP_001150459.1 arogenate dehydrogenase [Zea mays]